MHQDATCNRALRRRLSHMARRSTTQGTRTDHTHLWAFTTALPLMFIINILTQVNILSCRRHNLYPLATTHARPLRILCSRSNSSSRFTI